MLVYFRTSLSSFFLLSLSSSSSGKSIVFMKRRFLTIVRVQAPYSKRPCSIIARRKTDANKKYRRYIIVDALATSSCENKQGMLAMQ
jgi:hypothetical protein